MMRSPVEEHRIYTQIYDDHKSKKISKGHYGLDKLLVHVYITFFIANNKLDDPSFNAK